MATITTTDAAAAILRELYAINRTSRSLLGDTPLPGLTLATASLLGLLARRGDRRCAEIADELGIDASSVSRRLADLERLGLVRRRPDPRDGRAWLNSPTPEGVAALQTLRDRHLATVTASLAGWSDDELLRLLAALRRLHTDLTPERHAIRVTDVTGQEAYA